MTKRIPKKPKLNKENKPIYFRVLPLLCLVYSLKVIKLANEAMSVPAPPILTPINNSR